LPLKLLALRLFGKNLATWISKTPEKRNSVGFEG
jgi:hypothetical protein